MLYRMLHSDRVMVQRIAAFSDFADSSYVGHEYMKSMVKNTDLADRAVTLPKISANKQTTADS